jgi:acyl-homoserine-lactone acylase
VPQLTRTDYVANSNNSPWLSNPAAPITGYPAIFGEVGTEPELRARLGLGMIARRLAGTDGLGQAGFTLPTLQASMFGNRNYSAELARADVVAMCRAHPVLTAGDGTRTDVHAACDVLAAWNGRGRAGSRAEAFWELFFHPSPDWWRVPLDRARPLTTPRGIDGDNPDVQRSFADAVQLLQGNQAPRRPRWGGITLPGCPGERGCFNVIEASDSTGQLINAGPGQGAEPPPSGERQPSGRPPSIFGSSFIMAVELTPHGPRAHTLLTYSESANPNSPHHTDQTILFARGRWVTERFSEAEIAADPLLQTTTLRGSADTPRGGGLRLERNERSSSSSVTTAAGATAPGGRNWKKVVPGGDCECANGSKFAFWERRADPTDRLPAST